ncbi:carbohydrate kinase family protein [Niveispirillum fermenti]|uniref:carbohydrate kinase family protein n=1 Tax=Niveispirillum fermenti TaxID=1233113 RepID=UPI003A83CC78
MAQVVISGYATVDYVVHAQGRFDGQGTMAMRAAPDGAWPRAGGAVLYAGRQLARAGHGVRALTWVGGDADGAFYRQAAAQAGLGPDGIADTDGPTTRCLLVYHADGSHGCLLQAGAAALSDMQRGLLHGAALLVLTAGPASVNRAILADLPADARLAWIVKPDPVCFPPDLAGALAARADWLFCNAGERAWLEAARDGCGGSRPPSGQTLFETHGGEGVRVMVGVDGDGVTLPTTRTLAVTDATGAGDSFAGATLAALLYGASPAAAAQAGMQAAAALLATRISPAATP